MSTPACDPSTIIDSCIGGCDRPLHRSTSDTVHSNRACSAGHPRHVGRGLCSACRLRAAKGGYLDEFPIKRDAEAPIEGPRRAGRWQEQAACAGADTEEFFPDRDGRRGPAAVEAAQHRARATAVRYCAGCPVIAECAQLADESRHLGLFGGALRFRPPQRGGYAWELLVDRAPVPQLASQRGKSRWAA